MTDALTPRTIDLIQLAQTNREACGRCASAGVVDDAAVECKAAGRRMSYVAGRCRQRKWRPRPELPGVWVLSYQRTGSTYLCALLNQIGFNPGLDEHLHVSKQIDPDRLPRNNKVQPHQFAYRALALSDVLEQHPGTRFILLRRRDLVACAVSLYLAERTGVWSVHNARDAEKLSGQDVIRLDERWLMSCYKRVRRDDGYWQQQLDALGLNAHELVYEDVVSGPVDAVAGVYEWLGLGREVAGLIGQVTNRRQSVYRPETQVFQGRLKAMLAEGHGAKGDTPAVLGPRRRLAPSRVVVGALGCADPQYHDRRLGCQKTWLPELEAAGVEVLFLVGVGDAVDRPRVVEPEEHGRIGRELQIPCPDTYEALPQKTAAFCRWACEQRDIDYLFKCDDDTYLVPKRLLDVDLDGVDYLGTPLFIGIPYASGGAGYFLSRRAARVVAEHMHEEAGPEDLIVSQHLARHGIQLCPDRRFIEIGSEHRCPSPSNSLVTSHAYAKPWIEHDVLWASSWDDWSVPRHQAAPAAGMPVAGARPLARFTGRVAGLDFPKHDFGILTLPKNGGTSLWEMAHRLRFGRACDGNVYGKRDVMTGPINPRSRRVVVVRDPIERFVSGYCFLKRKMSLRDIPGLTFDKFVDQFHHFYRDDPHVRHHLKPQFLSANQAPLSFFTDVIPFSRFGRIYDLIEGLTGLAITRYHSQATACDKPRVTPEQRSFLEQFYALDYRNGYCEGARRDESRSETRATVHGLSSVRSNPVKPRSSHVGPAARTGPKRGGAGKLAMLFLLRADVHHPRLWERFIKQGGRAVSVYAHSKHLGAKPIPTDLIRINQIRERYETRWGHVSVARAMIALLKASLADTDNAFFIYASESCIPIYPFHAVRDVLLDKGQSWMRVGPCPERESDTDPGLIPPGTFLKASQWIALTRHDAQTVVDLCPVSGFDNVFAADEHFAATSLAMAGYDLDNDVYPHDLTYTDWPQGEASPKTFREVQESHLDLLHSAGCLFARKYGVESNIAQFQELLLGPAIAARHPLRAQSPR